MEEVGKGKKETKMKKSETVNGIRSFARGKLVLARVNLLDGTVQDFSIEVGDSGVFPDSEWAE